MHKQAPHRPRKSLGQHFLNDSAVIERIIQAIAPEPGDQLLEIGPGLGAITYPLLRRCERLYAIELDQNLALRLQQETRHPGALEVINADVLKFDLNTLPGNSAYRVVGNLPYNISTPLLFHLLASLQRIKDMHFMVQKEVALRMVAHPGSKSYGRLSIMLQQRSDCDYLFDVPPSSFKPPPKVDSAVVRLRPLPHPRHDHGDDAIFSRIVQAAFEQRRKTVANALKPLIQRDLFDHCGIDPGLRAENLGISDYACLSRACQQ